MFRFISRTALIGYALFITLYMTNAAAGLLDETVAHPPIPLLTESGEHVVGSGQPYSPKKSCAGSGCHDYEKITHAYHIEQGRDEARDDYGLDHGQPNLFSPGYFGGYNCMGGSNPDITAKKQNASIDEFADLGTPDLVMRCTRCHSGGGWMETDRNGRRYDAVDTTTVDYLDGDYYSRSVDEEGEAIVELWDWQASGVAENDCLLCHVNLDEMVSHDSQLDIETTPFRHATNLRSGLMRSGKFRYAATAMLEFMNLNMDEEGQPLSLVTFSRQDDEGDGSVSASDIALNDNQLPIVEWNREAFNEQGLVTIPMVRYPGNDNCMYCHLTSNSRRGFYGFGEGAEAVFDEDGLLVRDYQDDVHKGQVWTEANGEQRDIENCNACHSRNYYKESFGYQADLDANHNFLKGNSDMDIANDKDYDPPAKSCVYCHEDAETPAIPSGHEDMLAAHRERWKLAGDMTGYTEDSLNRITQTHLDVLACETCHITDKASRGTPMQIMYRYSATEDGTLKVRPYNARYRAQWVDKASGHILNKTERNSVFKMEIDSEGNRTGLLIDPISGDTLGNVNVRMSHGSWRFYDPEDYEGIVAQKGAYDNLLSSKGMQNPDTVLIWGASNFYVMSHNTRPAVDSVQCEECHEKTARGAFSSLISTSGVMGASNSKTVVELPDRRLIDEGIVEMAFPSMKADDEGRITENVEDLLYYSAINPSLSILGSANASVFAGYMSESDADSGLSGLGITNDEVSTLREQMPSSNSIYLFKPRYGDQMVKDTAIMTDRNGQAAAVMMSYRFLIRVENGDPVEAATQAGRMNLSQVYKIEARNSDGASVEQFPGTPLFIKLPWTGSNQQALTVMSSENGENWSDLQADQIIVAQPATSEMDGYVIVRTDHLSFFAVAERSETETTSGGDSSSSGSGGGGAVLILPLLLGWSLRKGFRRAI
ncbi:MAG: cytochrome C [Candidatus Thiodiazotropha taylori]|nr:cytochrome C [Candidatus Thiodiazotropha taylori]